MNAKRILGSILVSLVGAGSSMASVACEPAQCGLGLGYFIPSGQVNYDVTADHLTAKGVAFDPSGQNIDPAILDKLVDNVENCLGQPIDRSSFRVKFPANWHFSVDQSQEELPSAASDSGCLAKGLNGPGTCYWRAIVGCDNTIITTPSMYLFPDALIRLTTGRNPWTDTSLTKCASPGTAPLSGLSPIQ